jgi:hypothetical protein
VVGTQIVDVGGLFLAEMAIRAYKLTMSARQFSILMHKEYMSVLHALDTSHPTSPPHTSAPDDSLCALQYEQLRLDTDIRHAQLELQEEMLIYQESLLSV